MTSVVHALQITAYSLEFISMTYSLTPNQPTVLFSPASQLNERGISQMYGLSQNKKTRYREPVTRRCSVAPRTMHAMTRGEVQSLLRVEKFSRWERVAVAVSEPVHRREGRSCVPAGSPCWQLQGIPNTLRPRTVCRATATTVAIELRAEYAEGGGKCVCVCARAAANEVKARAGTHSLGGPRGKLSRGRRWPRPASNCQRISHGRSRGCSPPVLPAVAYKMGRPRKGHVIPWSRTALSSPEHRHAQQPRSS